MGMMKRLMRTAGKASSLSRPSSATKAVPPQLLRVLTTGPSQLSQRAPSMRNSAAARLNFGRPATENSTRPVDAPAAEQRLAWFEHAKDNGFIRMRPNGTEWHRLAPTELRHAATESFVDVRMSPY